jgi:hypothetical protein
MTIAASQNEAAFFSSRNVQAKFRAGTLHASLTTWLSDIQKAMNTPVGAGNVDSIAQRTVYNLIPIGRDLLNSVTESQFSANEVSIYLNRCCRAAESAALGGRITTGAGSQNLALLAKYNATWG